MPQLTKLFQPGKIGKMELRNRIIMAPMAHFGADKEGYPTSRLIDYYAARAKGGVGLIITGGTFFLPEAVAPGQLSIYDDKFINPLKELTCAIHENGAKIAVQFNHLGKRMSLSKFVIDGDRKKYVIAASPVRQVHDGFIPREATQEDINRIVETCGEAARRAKDAGFDAVEIHAAHGYLLSGFLSPATNKRKDAYGGSPENRARFACEIIKSIRKKVGPDFPISIRFSGCDYIEGGITLADTLRQAPLFVEAGANALHVSASAAETLSYQFIPYLCPDGMVVYLAEAIKKVVNVPVITVGKLGDPVLANRVLEEGKADFVALGRPLFADAELPNKAREGRLSEITRCLCCNACWAMPRDELKKFGGQRCTVNPGLFREREFVLRPAEQPKKVMVVGGGVAGMEAARVLAERGHQVTLFERTNKLGGQWNIVAQQKSKEVFANVTERLSRGLQSAMVKVNLNKEVTAQFVKDTKPDAVVVATGGFPVTPDIPGVNGKNVVQANDVIEGKVKVGNSVIVIGGRLIGMEVAESLAEQGKKVSIVTRGRMGGSRTPLPDHNTLQVLMNRYIDYGVSLYPYSSVYEIKDNGIYIDYDHQLLFGLLFLKADTIVLAVGTQAENRLAEELKGLVPELYQIGDCLEPRSAMYAIREGADIGRKI